MIENKLDQPGNWVEYLKANDEQHLKTIYAANYAKVKKYVLENSGSEADAKDVYHEAFIAVWRIIQLDKVSFNSVDNFQGYLFRVAQYNWLDQLRTRKRIKTESIDTMSLGDVMDIKMEKAEEEYIEKVKSGFAAMGYPCKDLLHRFYFLKQRLKEIAAVFSWTEATAKNNKYRCLQRLRSLVTQNNNNP